MNNRRKLIVALGAGALTAPFGAYAQQQPQKIARIGFLSGRSTPTATTPDPNADAFRQGLRDLGYIEGKNILIESRYAEAKPDRVPSLVAEFLQLKVDVLVSPYSPAIRAAKEATKTVPIVILTTDDPVAIGLVDSLARPGGNITGLTRLYRELDGKRLELVKEAVPGISRVGVLVDLAGAATSRPMEEYGAAGRVLKITLQALEVQSSKPNLEGAFLAAVKARVGALIVTRTSLLINSRKQIADLAIKHRLPLMSEGSDFVEAGGLMSYASNETESFKRAAYYVDRILKGAKPADLPVEQPTRFELVINMKTAKAIGLKIPHSLLQRVDKLIE